MNYRPTLDLSTIPDKDLYAELGRRRGAKRVTIGGGGRKRTCECGSCRKCKMREYKRQSRLSQRAGSTTTAEPT